MPKISLEDAKEGMVLAGECVDDKGNVLVKEGMVLSQQWIDRLRNRGISEIKVVDEAEKQAEAENEISGGRGPKDLQGTMKNIFGPVLNKPHMTALAKATYAFFRSQRANNA